MNLYDLSQEELNQLLESWGEKPFRTRQIWEWLYTHKVSNPQEMSNLSQTLRDRLSQETEMGVLALDVHQQSKDGTLKYLFKLQDEQLIESVLMSYQDGRYTACISTQAGCAMGCVFCATGQMGFARNLSAGEIVEQALWFARDLQNRGERLSNIVLMGMGEPLHNYDATLEAIGKMTSAEGLGIGQRHVTVSTVGLVPAMRRFADEKLQVGLAVSLHAATDPERDRLLPINRKWNLEALIEACHYFVEQTGRRITFEWALIADKTDTPQQAEALATLIRGLRCHVNAIPLNPTGGYSGKPSNLEQVAQWQQILSDHKISSTIRVRRGIDIQAGCGQLKAKVMKKEAQP